MAYLCSQEAEADLDAIWLYIAKESGSLEIADRVVDSLSDHFYALSLHPHLGRRRDEDLRRDIRSFPVGNYVIFYRVDEADLIILRVVHGSRDVQRIFEE